MRREMICPAILIALGVAAPSSPQSLREQVRMHGGNIELQVIREFSPVDLRELTAASDLVARVVVAEGVKSYLVSGDRSIASDYTCQILDRYVSKSAGGSDPMIVVTKPGGTVDIDGKAVTGTESDFPALVPGQEYILFLKLDANSGKYYFPYGAQGAFRVVAGDVEQVSRAFGTWNRDHGRMSVMEFAQALSSAVAAPE